ncbi:MAG: hypothetical protein IPN20_11240 [Haliscomenobacter sp.]|nr:hypothetical protein [Haliscomenobacter sp.]
MPVAKIGLLRQPLEQEHVQDVAVGSQSVQTANAPYRMRRSINQKGRGFSLSADHD